MIGGISFMKHPKKKFINSSYNFIMRIKNVFVFILLIMVLGPVHSQSPNPIVKRLSNQEISECRTPASITYNYITAFLQKDFVKVMSYVDLDSNEVQEIGEYLQSNGETYEALFSRDENLVALSSWRRVLDGSFEVVIANVEDIWLAKTDYGWMAHPDQIVKEGMIYIPGEEKPYIGIHEKLVYVTCSPSSEVDVLTFNEISRYENSQVKVFLSQKNDKWVVKELYFINLDEEMAEEVVEEAVEELVEEPIADADGWKSVKEQYPNPTVRRLSVEEIAECKTPAAVAYNFVSAVLQKDFVKMKKYMDPTIAIAFTDDNIKKEYGEYGINTLEDFFSVGKHGILTWIPALYRGYEVTIAYVQDLWSYWKNGSWYGCSDEDVIDGMVHLPGEDKPRVCKKEKKVYVTCCPSSEVNHVGFQDITSYGNLYVEIYLEQINGTWKVTALD